jgi:hypothetical protein
MCPILHQTSLIVVDATTDVRKHIVLMMLAGCVVQSKRDPAVGLKMKSVVAVGAVIVCSPSSGCVTVVGLPYGAYTRSGVMKQLVPNVSHKQCT